LAQVAALLACIQGILGSNQGWDSRNILTEMQHGFRPSLQIFIEAKRLVPNETFYYQQK
jgi:hypothetical protein